MAGKPYYVIRSGKAGTYPVRTVRADRAVALVLPHPDGDVDYELSLHPDGWIRLARNGATLFSHRDSITYEHRSIFSEETPCPKS